MNCRRGQSGPESLPLPPQESTRQARATEPGKSPQEILVSVLEMHSDCRERTLHEQTAKERRIFRGEAMGYYDEEE